MVGQDLRGRWIRDQRSEEQSFIALFSRRWTVQVGIADHEWSVFAKFRREIEAKVAILRVDGQVAKGPNIALLFRVESGHFALIQLVHKVSDKSAGMNIILKD